MKTLIKSQTSFLQSTAQLLSNHTQAISRLEVQISQLASSLSERLKETLPSQPLTNTRNSSQAHGAQDQQINQCNIVHILRSGVAPRSRDTYPDTCPKFFRPYCSIFFQYVFLGCDCLCYHVSDQDSQI